MRNFNIKLVLLQKLVSHGICQKWVSSASFISLYDTERADRNDIYLCIGIDRSENNHGCDFQSLHLLMGVPSIPG